MDFVQILLIAFFVYHLMLWIKNTRAYTLLKGMVFVGVILLVAKIFEMHTILWIFQNLSMVAVTAMLVIFQPELRKALEQLGEKNVISTIIPFDSPFLCTTTHTGTEKDRQKAHGRNIYDRLEQFFAFPGRTGPAVRGSADEIATRIIQPYKFLATCNFC